MSNPTVSVVIPSAQRLAPDGHMWLAKALRSVLAQTLRPYEVILGLDPGVAPYDAFRAKTFDGVIGSVVVHGDAPGHQSASNAAAKAATGRLLAFLEDDDLWEPEHLSTLVAAWERHGADFVSCSQQMVGPDQTHVWTGQYQGCPPSDVFHFPTASGWILPRLKWLELGGFDTRFHIHHDNEFLGRLNAHGVDRVHLIRQDEPDHPWIKILSGFADVVKVGGMERLTVRRTVHGGSILAQCGPDPQKAQTSVNEYATLQVMYGTVPW